MKTILALLALALFAQDAAASPIAGHWAGTATIGSESRTVRLDVEGGGDGPKARYSIPALGLEDMPLAGLRFDPATGELRTARSLTAKLSDERISGTLSPALLHGPSVSIDLVRAMVPPAPATIERDVSFASQGYILRGRLVAPPGDHRHPAMVSLHGSGPSTRWLALARARRFASAGYVTLIYDKPGSGESGGDWTMASLDDMARDALAALEYLRRQPEADPRRVGLWGHSQAGWVISRAAAMTDRIAFAIVLAGGGAGSVEVEEYGYRGRLRHAGADAAATDKAMTWVRDYFDYVRSGRGYEALTALLKSQAEEAWARALGIGTVYPTPEQQPKWSWVATYDPAADIARMRMPVLLLFAEDDTNSPTARSLMLWRQGLERAGNRNVRWKLFAEADHHFLVPGQAGGWPRIADSYYETQIDWLDAVTRK